MRRFRVLLAAVLLLLSACQKHWTFEWGTPNPAVPTTATQPARDPASGLATVSRFALPPEAQRTLTLIERGGPFPYARDGVLFGNREGRLPRQAGHMYHEYTVPTPGATDRGARRIVCGLPTECYYSDDHYASFRKIGP